VVSLCIARCWNHGTSRRIVNEFYFMVVAFDLCVDDSDVFFVYKFRVLALGTMSLAHMLNNKRRGRTNPAIS
jgi:hypothetical protein